MGISQTEFRTIQNMIEGELRTEPYVVVVGSQCRLGAGHVGQSECAAGLPGRELLHFNPFPPLLGERPIGSAEPSRGLLEPLLTGPAAPEGYGPV